ncbi:cell envelope biogenesis protein TonB [Bacteroidia bacterium]|nr:cell envelope biogenesis protein TonB [Bacteroidia bacterium]
MLFSKEIKFTSQEWCDYVFDNKNKTYGAYEMRTTSSKRHISAFLIAMAIIGFAVVLPAAVQKVKASVFPQGGINDSLRLVAVTIVPEKPEPKIELPVNLPPPPALISTIQFAAPKMGDISEITDENEFKPQDEVMNTDLAIGSQSIDGDIGGTLHPDEVAIVHAITEIKPEPRKIELVPAHKPEFPGGEKEMYAVISKNLHYPAIAIDNRVKGTATIRFVVETDGSVSGITLLRGFNSACDNEALRVIKLMGAQKWVPGRDDKGIAVRAYFTIPIKFILKDN